jgi:hypothetical protein
VHLLLPDAPLLEGVAIGRDAVVGGIVQAELRGKVRGEPLPEFLTEPFVLCRELEVHDRGRG